MLIDQSALSKLERFSLEEVCVFRTIFWDFDGVIKESHNIKEEGFIELFSAFGDPVVSKIREHHRHHSGVSRLEKIPIYLNFANQASNSKTVNEYASRYSDIVFSEVVNSDWVPGVEEFLKKNAFNQLFVVCSATPQQELEKILESLDIGNLFVKAIGAPTPKDIAINQTIDELGFDRASCLMIGDSSADLKAAKSNRIAFVLRAHAKNKQIFKNYTGPFLEDLLQK